MIKRDVVTSERRLILSCSFDLIAAEIADAKLKTWQLAKIKGSREVLVVIINSSHFWFDGD